MAGKRAAGGVARGVQTQTDILSARPQRPGRKPNAARAYLASLGKGSRRAVRQRLCVAASLVLGCPVTRPEVVAWHRFTWQDGARMRDALASGVPRYAPQTANVIISAWRTVMLFCWRLGLLTREQSERVADVDRVRGMQPPRRRYVSAADRDALLELTARDGSVAGVRDAAILALGFFGGLRRAEMVELRIEDVDLERDQVHVLGKGGRRRVVFLGPGLPLMARWLDVRGGTGDQRVLCSLRHGRMERRKGCSEGMVYQMVNRRATHAGMEDLHPHDLRRACATHLLEAGVDVLEVQRYLGHSRPDTTALYDMRALTSMRSAHARAFGRGR